MMKKLGLKVFSINRQYCDVAAQLYRKGVYDYIELYTVPQSFDDMISIWKNLNIPYVVHAPHFKHGMNLARKDHEAINRKLYEEAARFADALNAKYIIFHPGIGGDIQETGRQIKKFLDKRIIIENKPYHAVSDKNTICNGYLPADIDLVMREGGCGFCFDVGHCFCAANALGKQLFDFFDEFLRLKPVMVHVSDNDAATTVDGHRHFGGGSYNMAKVWEKLPSDIMVTIETDKDSQDSLDDFVKDVVYLKDLRS
jgi:sugar phosphate isomerase/epimerase